MEKIIKKLTDEVAFATQSGEPMDEASWGDQYGMLITYNEAKAILDALKALKIVLMFFTLCYVLVKNIN